MKRITNERSARASTVSCSQRTSLPSGSSQVTMPPNGVGAANRLNNWPRAVRGTNANGVAPGSAHSRRVLVGMGAIVVALGAGGMFLSSLGRRSAQVAQRLVLPKPAAVTVAPFAPEDPAFDATPGLSPQLTANADFYIVDTALFKPRVDVATWRLAIDGHVDRPYELTYNDLLAMDAVEQVQTLECISNPVGGELISTATWVGARMPDL